MKSFMIALVAIMATISCMASDMFLIGMNRDELRNAYGATAVVFSSDSELAFDTQIGRVSCVLTYRLEQGVAVSALCLVSTRNRRFVQSLSDFSAILGCVLKAGKVTETSIRLNGVPLVDSNHGLETPKNYIRMSGDWKAGFYFTARLDGDNTTDIQKSGVSAISVSVERQVAKPAADQN